MKKTLAIIMSCLLLTFMYGCAAEDASFDQDSIEQQNIVLNKLDIDLSAYVSEVDSIEVYDIEQDRILFIVYEKMENKEGNQIPEIIYKSLYLYNYINGSMEYQKELTSDHIIIAGEIIREGDIVYCEIEQPGSDNITNYSINCIRSGNVEQETDSGKCLYHLNNLPYFLEINKQLIYSYEKINEENSVYGINKIDLANMRVSELYANTYDDNNSLINNELKGNKNEYIYFVEENNQGVFIIGDEKGIKNRLFLAENEKVDSYCLLDGYAVFAFSIDEENHNSHSELFLKDYDGNIVGSQIISTPRHSLYRMSSNNYDRFLSVDNLWNLFSVTTVNESLNVQQIYLPMELADLSQDPLSIYNIGNDKYMLFYYIGSEFVLLEYK